MQYIHIVFSNMFGKYKKYKCTNIKLMFVIRINYNESSTLMSCRLHYKYQHHEHHCDHPRRHHNHNHHHHDITIVA